MERQTVDFGIDLGTTNSAIARATSKGVKVVKNRDQGDITPSAVARKGQVFVGDAALDKPELRAATQFKRLMGGTSRVTLADETEMSPEELSAEVLKELKASVQRRFDTEIEHVVITVPAMFLQPQCEATHRAAKLAGLNAVALVQEPIAAATAYLNDDPEPGDYLVYDLGGGTFDVSLVRLEDNEMSVIAHGGDNYLGGSDFDVAITGHIRRQIERSHGVQSHLSQKTFESQLLRTCETAKIRLSDEAEVTLDLSDLQLPVNQFVLTRAVLEDLIEESVTRTIRLARERLEQAGLNAEDIHSVLLVGGPTQMPYVRRRLKAELGIPLSTEQDPMTVVATGAAIHASTLLKPDRGTKTAVAPGERRAVIEAHYDPVSPDLTTTLAAKVTDPAGFTGEVRITRARNDWETGWISLKNGAFSCNVSLEPGKTTDFTISLRDMSGRLYTVEPSVITIRNGIAPATPVTPYHYGVALSDGSMNVVIKENQSLPTFGTARFVAANDVIAGSPDELRIYFLEGKSPIAEDNVHVGELTIRGTDISRTLREGETIEIRINMDESRRLKARVSVPILDADYPVELHSLLEAPNVPDLRDSFAEADSMRDKMAGVVSEADEKWFREASRDLEQIEAEVKALRSNSPATAERVAKKLADVKAQLRPLEANYRLLALHETAKKRTDRAEKMAQSFENRLDETTARELTTEADKCLRLEDERGLNAVIERADRIYWKHYTQTRECWTEQIQYLRNDRRFATDAVTFDEYVKRAHDCLERDDYEGVRVHTIEAWRLIPDDVSKEKRFSDAGLRLP